MKPLNYNKWLAMDSELVSDIMLPKELSVNL